MTLETRISAFARLGDHIRGLSGDILTGIEADAKRENPWFTDENVAMAFDGLKVFLEEGKLRRWTAGYALDPTTVKTIGVAMAGNIPMVGFHDFICVLISGHKLKAKFSSQDKYLMNYVAQQLIKIEPAFNELISFEERLNHVDGMIATGGNNTARYFEYYFRNVPHIIRKNRSSCAVLSGEETTEDFNALGVDVFSYFGLGCRNISKLYLPVAYDFNALLFTWEKYRDTIINHNKYVNNYDYQRSILLVNKIPFYDNGAVLLKEETAFVSPISMLYYEYYSNAKELERKLASEKENIQCIVSHEGWIRGSFPFGKSQFPEIDDYADGVDTLKFLEALTD